MKRNVELSTAARDRLAKRLHDLCEERGMSLRDLAMASGVGLGTVNGVGSGSREPNLSAMLAFVRALGLSSIEELLGPFASTQFH